MPYIADMRRGALASGDAPAVPGELNYQFTILFVRGVSAEWIYRSLMDEYVEIHGPLSYQLINDVMGAVNSAIFEARRRAKAGTGLALSACYSAALSWYDEVAGPYEDAAIERNGDVWA